MNRFSVLLLAAPTIGSFSTCQAEAPSAIAPAAANAVAVVELFTSQGCSSCPPAEDEIARLNVAAADSHAAVFTLAFHVDYWDRLGWRDPFSSPAFSARQYDYSHSFHLDQVYTPQMIVNGAAQFVGSDQASADRAIAAALSKAAPVQLTLTVQRDPATQQVRVQFGAPAAAADCVVNVAVVEQGLSTKITRGENSGRTLDQPSVVRWFATSPAGGDGKITIPPLNNVQTHRACVLAYVQRPDDGAVLGATATPLPATVVAP